MEPASGRDYPIVPSIPELKRQTAILRAKLRAGTSEDARTLAEIEQAAARILASLVALRSGDTALDTYGNKHKNLVKLIELQKLLEIPGVATPPPIGLEDDVAYRFLQEAAPKFFQKWQEFGTQYHASCKDNPRFLESPEAQNFFQEMDSALVRAFEEASCDPKSYQKLGFHDDLLVWLETLAANGRYLIVRSTGDEDSRTHANAGKNETILYVTPTWKDMCLALGQVVRSYVRYPSLQSQINAGVDPFSKRPKLSVTTQELIGEPLGGAQDPKKIPISVVMFTNEPVYVGGEKFRVLRISATFGHGEAVVGNKGVACDSVLVLVGARDPSKLMIYYDSQSKPERLAPVQGASGKVVLMRLDNPKELQDARVLDDEMIARLYELGVLSEAYFEDNATDLELVIREGTIYPVQARPVIRPEMLPSYLDLEKIADRPLITKTLYAETIVPAKASVVAIKDTQNELLHKQDLDEADKKFIKSRHKLVIVDKPEPAHSHPIVNFSGMGVPCMVEQEADLLAELIGEITGDKCLVACMQAGTINVWSGLDALEKYVSKGYVVHPAKVAISLPLAGSVARRDDHRLEVPQEVKRLLVQTASAATSAVALEHIKALKKHELVQSLSANIQLLEAAESQVAQVTPILKAAQALEKAAHQAFKDLKVIFTLPEAGRLEKLLHLKVVSSLLTQPSKGGLHRYSLLNIQQNFAAAFALIDYQKKLTHPAKFSDLLLDGTLSPIPAFFENWQKFLLELEGAKSVPEATIERFRGQVSRLREMGALPIALTLFFDCKADVNSQIESFLRILPPADEPVVERLHARLGAIKTLHTQLSAFGDPKKFEAMWSSFCLKQNGGCPNRQNVGRRASIPFYPCRRARSRIFLLKKLQIRAPRHRA